MIPVMGLLIGSFIIMVRSFDTGENWKIALSLIGFSGFFTLTGLFVYVMIKKRKSEKKQ